MPYRTCSTVGLPNGEVIRSGGTISDEQFNALSKQSQEMLIADEHVEKIPDPPAKPVVAPKGARRQSAE
jgi:hypothetical protein